MKPILANAETLKQLFAGLVEDTFQTELGVADPKMTDYLVDLLVRFVRYDMLYRLRNPEGKRLEDVAEMLLEAEQRESTPRREIYRHIGDFTLFWSGVFPESLAKLQSASIRDSLLDYCQQGKRSYRIAASYDEEPFRAQAPVLRRLSDEFELCCFGLNRVRAEWQKRPDAATSPWSAEQN